MKLHRMLELIVRYVFFVIFDFFFLNIFGCMSDCTLLVSSLIAEIVFHQQVLATLELRLTVHMIAR